MSVAIAALSLLSLVNLMVTAGVVRRLREHRAILDKVAGEPPQVMRPAGAVVDHFASTSVDGEPIERDLLAGLTLVGFFSPTCGPCHERLPDFLARARSTPGGRGQVIAVVVERGEPAEEMVTSLSAACRVAVEPPGGDLAESFGVRGFPAFGLVDRAGVIVASGIDLSAIPVPVAG